MCFNTLSHPTAAELRIAAVSLSTLLQDLEIEHGIIGSAATFLHDNKYNLPCLLPTRITVLIQPCLSFSADDLADQLCQYEYSDIFSSHRKNGAFAPRIIVRRLGDKRGDLLVELEIVDHCILYDWRVAYDPRPGGNEVKVLNIYNEEVRLLNPQWLLRQKIQIWNARKSEGMRRKDDRHPGTG